MCPSAGEYATEVIQPWSLARLTASPWVKKCAPAPSGAAWSTGFKPTSRSPSSRLISGRSESTRPMASLLADTMPAMPSIAAVVWPLISLPAA